MWIIGSNFFVSLVNKDCREDQLLVRARRSGDIARFLARRQIECIDQQADYLFRAPVPIETIVDGLRTELARVGSPVEGYANFKASVVDRELRHALTDVWMTMRRLQHVQHLYSAVTKPAPHQRHLQPIKGEA
jgi:hypothetical protein